MSKEYQAKQAALVAEHIKKQDIIITTALIPGRPAPRLVSAADGEGRCGRARCWSISRSSGAAMSKARQAGKGRGTVGGRQDHRLHQHGRTLAASASGLYARTC